MNGFSSNDDSKSFAKLSEIASLATDISDKLCPVCSDTTKNDILPQMIASAYNTPLPTIPTTNDDDNYCGDFACLNIK